MRSLAPLLALVLFAAGSAHAWMASPERPHHADLAERAAQGLPAEWRALVEREREAFRAGALDPDGITDPDAEVHTFYHTYEPAEGDGGGLWQVQRSLHDAAAAIRDGAPERDVAYKLGFMTHFATDLAVPFHTADGLYDHEHHGAYETAAADHHHRDLAPTHAAEEVPDPAAYMTDIATQSAARSDALVAAFDRADGAWTQELDDTTRDLEQLAVNAASDMMATAWALADPARPEPTFDEGRPLPTEPEDVGLSLQEQWRTNPTLVIGAAVVLLALGIAIVVALSRRRERSGRRPL